MGLDLDEFPNLKAWFERLEARPLVAKVVKVGEDMRRNCDLANDKNAQAVLFGPTARKYT